MGMFDYVVITDYKAFKRKDIPVLKRLKEFQTKDFDCDMTTIEIRGKRVYIEKFQFKTVPLEERPYPEATGLLKFAGCLERIDVHKVRVTGPMEFSFYTSDEDKNWYEWTVYMWRGKIRKIIRVS